MNKRGHRLAGVAIAVVTFGALAACTTALSGGDAGTDAGPMPSDAIATDAVTPDGARATRYYSDPCGSGDPVGCVFKDPVELPDPTYKKCSELGIQEDDACATVGAKCVLVPARQEGEAGVGCSQRASYLTCLTEKRDAGVGGCPVSTREKKKNIQYLSEADRERVSRDVLSLKIASYDYRDPSDGPSPSLGFILEDSPEAPFVLRDHSRVDLYAYTSSLVVTVQRQQAELERLKRDVAALSEKKRR